MHFCQNIDSKRVFFWKSKVHTASFVDQILVLGGVRLQIEQAPQDFSKGKKSIEQRILVHFRVIIRSGSHINISAST